MYEAGITAGAAFRVTARVAKWIVRASLLLLNVAGRLNVKRFFKIQVAVVVIECSTVVVSGGSGLA